ncbi:MAG: hypothetical protein K0U72_09915 [Gammaproteobacteria bacterium]|nr:hypothetical protein [Gammaproteobacteria bacterium]
MRDLDFNALASELIGNGISPRHAHRTVNELRDHYDDLVDAAVDAGANSKRARRHAAQQLGSMDDFVAAMASQRELKTWAFRYPRLAVVVYPLACVAVLPAFPVFAGMAHRDLLTRWGTALLAAGLITATMMLVLQLTILLS